MRTEGGRGPARLAWLAVAGVLAILAAFAVGCGSSDDSSSSDSSDMPTEVGAGEGELNLIAWAGYVEDGSSDPKVDWVTDFEKETGCQVNAKVAGTSDEMVELMRSGQYDGVSASGNATARLVEGGDVAPVNVDLVPNYATVFDDLKDQPYNTFDGVHYGIPHGRGANLLMWNKETDPDIDGSTWAPLLDPRGIGEVQGSAQRLRRPDLHRGRGPLPQGASAGPRDREPVRAGRGPVQCRGRPAQAAAPERRRVLERFREADLIVRERRRQRRNDVAIPVLHPAG